MGFKGGFGGDSGDARTQIESMSYLSLTPKCLIFTRPGVAGTVLQTHLSLINSLGKP